MTEDQEHALQQALWNVALDLGQPSEETLALIRTAIENDWTTEKFIMEVKGA